jgi:peptide deformylase
MSPRPILIIPDTRLRQVADPVVSIDKEIATLVEDMFETMYLAPGIGLAAPQIGVMKRVLVLDVAKRRDEEAKSEPMAFINPVITWVSEEISIYEEGCLSIPDFYEAVERPAVIRVAYLDPAGASKEIEADGILATCLQHEIDHLNGVLFIDHISRLKRARVMRKFEKAAKDREYGDSRPSSRP